MNFLTTHGHPNAHQQQGEVKNSEDNQQSPESWLRNKKEAMRDEDLSIYSKKMGLRCPRQGSHADYISHIMRYGKKSCKFVSLILEPLLYELRKLNYTLNGLGI